MLDVLSHWTFFYLALVVGVTFLLGWIIWRRLASLQRSRVTRLKRQDAIDSIPTDIDKSAEVKRRRERIAHLKARFTITRRMILILLLLLALAALSLPFIGTLSPGFLSIAVAILSVIIGIAAKPVVENLICGLVLCFGKLARIGDTVLVDGEYGVIEDVTLTHCVVKRWDWLRYVVPNTSMMTKEFVNYSLFDAYRWVYVEFWVDYGVDMALVESIAKAALSKVPMSRKTKRPSSGSSICNVMPSSAWPSPGRPHRPTAGC